MALSSAPADRRNLSNRILSGLVLGPVVLLLAFVGDWPFDLALGAAGALGLAEWIRIVSAQGPAPTSPLRPWSAAAIPAIMLAYWAVGAPAACATLGLSSLLVGLLVRVTDGTNPWLGALGVPYVGLAMLGLAWLRDAAFGGWPLVLFILLVVWASDIGAFVAGRAIGGPRLAPGISPNKTWAGFMGAIAFSVAIAFFWASFGFHAARPGDAALLAAFLSIVGQGGDLFESAIKRRFQVKDSGGLIPGHGGMLDRIDALLWAAPVFVLLYAFKMTGGLQP